ncbi:MAG: 4a-hydroxytetrahydrobiopterin dehydratase [Crocinitomicaceae bacterium]|jgi:4a-hydroxytetrahydrobiopterin dehydratase|nr:4a-hydroxytetrahydrobiopterin dehydratase [Crocinitomicaceae bacterium]
MSWLTHENKLKKTILFKTQTDLAQFLLNIAKIADKMNHHPDYVIRKCIELDISLSTHDENGITEKDYALAEKIDEELNSFSKS